MKIYYPRLVQPGLRLLVACGGLALVNSAASAASEPAVAGGGRMHWEIGVTYAAGVNKVVDQMEINFGVTKKSVWPVGLKLGGYDEFSSGWCVGGSVGPCEVIAVDRGYYDDTNYNYIVPVTVDVRYIFPGQGEQKFYIRAGVTEPLAGGDYIGSGTPGPAVAIGGEVWHGRNLSVGLEAGYDGSKVEVKQGYYYGNPATKVTPIGFNATIFVRF